jgi:MFS family permease
MPSSLFSVPFFTRFWLSRSASGFAYQMLSVAVGWQVYELTHSPMSLGLIGLMQFLPQFLLTLPAGHVADQFERRRIVIICQCGQAAVTLVLALGSLSGWLNEWAIFACAFVIGACRAFEMPTLQAVLPGLAPQGLLPRMLAWSASVWRVAVIMGPALGGVLYLAGSAWVYGVCALFFALAAWCVGGIPKPARPKGREPATLRSVLGGIEYIRGHPQILGAISLDLFSVLLGGATALMPVFARDILHTGPWGLGMLQSAPSVGALAMSLYLTRRPLSHAVGKKMFAAVALFGLATVVFGFSRCMPVSLAALAVLGASDMISVVIRATLVQIETPDELRGRVSAVNSIFIGTSNQLGEFESGLTAAWFGTVGSVVVGGLGTLVVVLLWMRLFPSLLRRDKL